jgi:hypothetical protein
MEIVAQVLVLVHLIGFAALLGGQLVQLRTRDPEVNGAMLSGAWIALLTGAGLVAVLVVESERVPYGPLGVKLALTALLVLLVTKNRRFVSIPRGLWVLLTLMTLATTAVLVLWR